MDWIRAKIGSSLQQSWITLKEQLASDLVQWRHVHDQNENKLVEHNEVRDCLVFLLKANYFDTNRDWVRVYRTETAITFVRKNTPGTTEELVPTLNDKVELRLQHNGNELEIWQASRLLLEPILFPKD